MRMSDIIADFIQSVLQESGGVAELSRKAMADQFDCVPSQINYVIETRFTPEDGYLVQSRRGGGGYIRIVRRMDDEQSMIYSVAKGVDEELTYPETVTLTGALFQAKAIDQREVNLLLGACGDQALALIGQEDRDRVRAEIFRHALYQLIG